MENRRLLHSAKCWVDALFTARASRAASVARGNGRRDATRDAASVCARRDAARDASSAPPAWQRLENQTIVMATRLYVFNFGGE